MSNKKYWSDKSDKNVTPAQYITELFCELVAGHKLPKKFWYLPKYKAMFRRYVADINKLLKKYDERAIINTIQSGDKRLRNINSVRFPPFQKLLEQNQKILKEQQKQEGVLEDTALSMSGQTRPTTKNKSIISQLKSI